MENYLQKLNKDMELGGFQESTKKYYYSNVAKFLNYWDKPPQDATESDIAEYLHGLIRAKAINPTTINKYNTAIRFFIESVCGVSVEIKIHSLDSESKRIVKICSSMSLPRINNIKNFRK